MCSSPKLKSLEQKIQMRVEYNIHLIATLKIRWYCSCFSGIEGCVKDREQKLLHCETAINICFLIHFGIRFLAASDKLWFWLEMNSIVDFCTVPPVFVGIYLNRHYLGIYISYYQSAWEKCQRGKIWQSSVPVFQLP